MDFAEWQEHLSLLRCSPRKVVILVCGDDKHCDGFYSNVLCPDLKSKNIAFSCDDYPTMIWFSENRDDMPVVIDPDRLKRIDKKHRQEYGDFCWAHRTMSDERSGQFQGIVILLGVPKSDIPYYYRLVQNVFVVDLQSDIDVSATLGGSLMDPFEKCPSIKGTSREVAEALTKHIQEIFFVMDEVD